MGNLVSHLQLVKGKASGMSPKAQEIFLTLLLSGLSTGAAYLMLSKILAKLDPTNKDKIKSKEVAADLMNRIGIEIKGDLNDYELCIASNLVDTRDINVNWEDIGGLQSTIDEINEVVILPFTRPDLFKSSELLRPPKGVLLHGPPGCGKTMLAKATAKASGARFINLQASALFDKWYGESQKRAEAIFSFAAKIEPTIIFIDEIDAFLRARSENDHEATALVKAQFMTLWDGLTTDSDCSILIMGATNRPMDVDPAFRRRMPCMLQLSLPRETERVSILHVILKNEAIENKDLVIEEMAHKTNNLSGSDLKELCRHAALFRVRDYISTEIQSGAANSRGDGACPILRKMNLQDFNKALEKFRNSSIHAAHVTSLQELHDAAD